MKIIINCFCKKLCSIHDNLKVFSIFLEHFAENFAEQILLNLLGKKKI